MRLFAVVLHDDDRDAGVLTWAGGRMVAGDVLDVVLPVPAQDYARVDGRVDDPAEPSDDRQRTVLTVARTQVQRVAPQADVRLSSMSGPWQTCVSRFGAIADVIVVGADDLAALEGFGCPVVVVPSVSVPESERSEVVVPLVGGDVPRRAIRVAMEAAARERAAVVVIDLYRAPAVGESVRAIVASETQQTELLDLQLATMRPPRVPVITQVVREDLGTAFARLAPRARLLVLDVAAATGAARDIVEAALKEYGVAVLIVPS